MKKVLVTGGAGFIGSHTTVELIQQGYTVIVVDNFSNSSEVVLERVERISGVMPEVVRGDICDARLLDQLFTEHEFDSVIHFAGLKAVGESVEQPMLYYKNNVQGSVQLFQAMVKHGCQRLVFSSSSTVYGEPNSVPITEDFPLSATNPYGHSKLMVEQILRDLAIADPRWQISILRYFNPVGAHPSGLMGEDPSGIPNNLMPYIAQVGVGKLKKLAVFGDDYPTEDGTGVRDYIHVVDLAKAHTKALAFLSEGVGCRAHNIGTGQGYSVLEMVKAFESASGVAIPYSIEERRSGDVAKCYADPSLSAQELGWKAENDLNDMMRDQWNWQSKNPNGYTSK